MSKIKNRGLDQYGAGPFERKQFITAGVEGVKRTEWAPPTSIPLIKNINHSLADYYKPAERRQERKKTAKKHTTT